MDRVNTFHGFDFDNQLPFDEKVNPLRTNDGTTIADRYRLFRLVRNPTRFKFDPCESHGFVLFVTS